MLLDSVFSCWSNNAERALRNWLESATQSTAFQCLNYMDIALLMHYWRQELLLCQLYSKIHYVQKNYGLYVINNDNIH